MNAKRQRAQDRFIKLINDIDETGENGKVWKDRFATMTDKEFHEWMKEMRENPLHTHIDIQYNQSDKRFDKMLDIDHTEKLSKKYGVQLREHVAFPHLNADDPDNPFVTATPVPVLYIYIRKMQQMLQKKNFSAGTVESINPITGQVTGDSKAAALGDSQTFSLATTNQKDAIREFLTIRSDNEEGKLKMLNEIEKNGKVSYSDCRVDLNNSQSVRAMKAFLTGACLRTDGLKQKTKPVDREIQ